MLLLLLFVFSPSAFNDIKPLNDGGKGGCRDEEVAPYRLDQAEPVGGGGRLARLRLRHGAVGREGTPFGTSEIGSSEDGSGESGSPEVGIAEASLGEISFGEISSPESSYSGTVGAIVTYH